MAYHVRVATMTVSVGQRLREERERRGMPRIDVTRATKIFVHHVAALEFGRFDDIAEPAVLESYVRAYAEHLGLDGTAMVADLRRERGHPESGLEPAPAPEPQAAAPLGTPNVSRSGSGRLGWILGLIGAIAVLAIWWASKEDRTPSLSSPAPAVVAPPPIEAIPSEAPPPVAAAAPAGPDEPLVSTTGVSIPEHGVGTGVANHRLVGRADRFEEGRRVLFWTAIVGGRPGGLVRHVWIREGREVQTITLPIGSGSWRTQSSRFVSRGAEGRWAVEARDEHGTVLARDTFTVVP